MAVRDGNAEWHGDVRSGSGEITVGDGVFQGPYSFASRFEDAEGTNPEQPIAAALAGCFRMALASILSATGHAPESVRANARVQRPGLSRELPAGGESLTWVANSATVISDEQDGVLADTFVTREHSLQLAEAIADTGKNHTHIYITQGGRQLLGVESPTPRSAGL